MDPNGSPSPPPSPSPSPPPPPSGCLLGNSQILLQDGSTKAISEIQPKDVIVDGNLNPVTVEVVVGQYLDNGQLYEFSNGGPVFTEGHLFYVDIENEKLGKYKNSNHVIPTALLYFSQTFLIANDQTYLNLLYLAGVDPANYFSVVPQMKNVLDVKPLNNVTQLLQYQNGTVLPSSFDFHLYQEMSPNTEVYFLVTSGNDGSYIANNFITWDESPKLENWKYTYATVEMVVQFLPNELSVEEYYKLEDIAIELGNIWDQAVMDHVFDPNNLVTIDPVDVLDKNKFSGELCPSKVKLAQYLLETESEKLHRAFIKESMSKEEKLSLMKDIVDKSEAFFNSH